MSDSADADAKTERDRLYAELRTISDLAQKLSDRTNRAAIRLATLPVIELKPTASNEAVGRP